MMLIHYFKVDSRFRYSYVDNTLFFFYRGYNIFKQEDKIVEQSVFFLFN
jgi:hypothetical protein